ncbi:MAG: hypothetical protein M3Y54_15825 [Bacteroidota bacterium]|nr:hypothetical protein [Bacteroidota bacterium]
MSLLTFFSNQRRRWFDNIGDYSPEYFAGAWAALLHAETVFMRTPLHNFHLENQALQRELNSANLKLERQRQQLESTEPQRIAASHQLKEANRISQHDRRRAALTRRALERMQAVADNEEFEPEVRLCYLQQLIQSHLALQREANPDGQPQ